MHTEHEIFLGTTVKVAVSAKYDTLTSFAGQESGQYLRSPECAGQRQTKFL